MDGICKLSDDVLSHIVSFLSAKEAARTRIVSKNWLNLVNIEQDLVFEPKGKISGRLRYLLYEGLLARYFGNRVSRFSLKLQYVENSRFKLVNAVLCNVVKRGVVDLELNIKVGKGYRLPFELFSCRTIVKMKLGPSLVIKIIPNHALLPALKTLVINSVRFKNRDGCAFQKLLSACPVLEELVIDVFNCEDWKWSNTVSSQTLKRLSLRRKGWFNYDDITFEAISFDTPSLEYFRYNDVLRDEYPVVNFSSLVEAKLELRTLEYEEETYNATNLVKGFKNVQILSLDQPNTVLLFNEFKEAVPVFQNLLHLSISTDSYFCWEAVESLLERSPNLKTLTIQGSLHFTRHVGFGLIPAGLKSVCKCLKGYSFLEACPIETLKITKFQGEIGEMVQIKHILQNLPSVKLVEVYVQAKGVYKKLQIVTDLKTLPTASAKCKVEVIFS